MLRFPSLTATGISFCVTLIDGLKSYASIAQMTTMFRGPV